MTTRNLTCAEVEARLGDYLEGTLDDAAVADVELHRAGCAACSAMLRDLEAIVRDAAALPALAPSRDLWPSIDARLEPRHPERSAPTVIDFASRAAERRSQRPAPSWRWLRTGAMAAGLVGITAISTWVVSRNTPPARVASAVPAPATAEANVGTPSLEPSRSTPDVESVSPSAERAAPLGTPIATPVSREARPSAAVTLGQEISSLRGVLTQRREDLDPRTVAILETSLATIDSAIADARRALEVDPASRFLSSQLDKALEKKLGLLRTAALLPART